MGTTRKDFLRLAAGGGGALGLGLTPRALRASPLTADRAQSQEAPRKIDILILGGTGLIGPFQVRYALARGHNVTLFNRGSGREMFPELETLIGDRNSDGGEVLAPDDPSDPIQIIDVRDFTEWMIRLGEDSRAGVFNVVGPRTPRPMAELLYGIRAVTTAETTFTWVHEDFLREVGVRPYSNMLVWRPPSMGAGFARFDLTPEVEAGRSDNGVPFASSALGRLSRLSRARVRCWPTSSACSAAEHFEYDRGLVDRAKPTRQGPVISLVRLEHLDRVDPRSAQRRNQARNYRSRRHDDGHDGEGGGVGGADAEEQSLHQTRYAHRS